MSSDKDGVAEFIFSKAKIYFHDLLEIIIEAIIVSLLYFGKILLDKNNTPWYLFLICGFLIFSFMILLIMTKNLKRKIRSNVSDRLRSCLVSIRKLCVLTSQTIYDLSHFQKVSGNFFACNNNKCNSPSITSYCYKQRFLKSLKHKVCDMLYHQLCLSNKFFLEKMYRVSLFEPFNDEDLKIVAFSNYEKERPKARSLDIGFKNKEGVAGNCWHYKLPIAINDIKEYINKFRNKPESIFKILDKDDDLQFGSIVCYPIINRLMDEEKVEAILSIDCDKINAFNIYDQEQCKVIKREIFPYVRFLCLLYSIINVLE